MEVSSLIIISIVGLLIQYLIVAYAVHNATAIMRQHSKIQTALFSQMARKAGVTEDEIQEALNTK